MGSTRGEIVDRIWRGVDPFAGFPSNLYALDMQGWGSGHHYLTEAIEPVNDRLIVEIGVWKGASSIRMAQAMKDQGVRGTIICVDTWLGSVEHWTQDWFADLACDHGYPTLQRKFMNNVVAANVQDIIVPLPLDSVNASQVLKHFAISADVIHIDAGHDYASVMSDLKAWWPVLAPGGLYIGDDYHQGGEHWAEVQQAHDAFFADIASGPLENVAGKCRLRKPAV
jgi:predicted O-methyltransferase YrrM